MCRINEDGHTPLDIAIMVNSQEIGELLFEHGAKENSKCEFISGLTSFNVFISHGQESHIRN